MKEIEKKHGKGSITTLKEAQIDAEFLSTGSLALDLSLGGGIPKGHIVEIYGREGSIKTALALKIIALLQKNKNSKGAYIDLEGGVGKKSWVKKLGVDQDRLYITRPQVKQLDMLVDLVSSKQFDIVILDSVSAIVHPTEFKDEVDKNHYALIARLMGPALRKIINLQHPKDLRKKENKTCVLFINQIRYKVNQQFGNPETTPGGEALTFCSSQRIRFSVSGRIYKDKDGKTYSTGKAFRQLIKKEIKFQIMKNKLGADGTVGNFMFNLETGDIDNAEALIQYGSHYGIIERKGAYYEIGKERVQGKDAVTEYLQNNPKEYEKIYKELVKKVGVEK